MLRRLQEQLQPHLLRIDKFLQYLSPVPFMSLVHFISAQYRSSVVAVSLQFPLAGFSALRLLP